MVHQAVDARRNPGWGHAWANASLTQNIPDICVSQTGSALLVLLPRRAELASSHFEREDCHALERWRAHAPENGTVNYCMHKDSSLKPRLTRLQGVPGKSLRRGGEPLME